MSAPRYLPTCPPVYLSAAGPPRRFLFVRRRFLSDREKRIASYPRASRITLISRESAHCLFACCCCSRRRGLSRAAHCRPRGTVKEIECKSSRAKPRFRPRSRVQFASTAVPFRSVLSGERTAERISTRAPLESRAIYHRKSRPSRRPRAGATSAGSARPLPACLPPAMLSIHGLAPRAYL